MEEESRRVSTRCYCGGDAESILISQISLGVVVEKRGREFGSIESGTFIARVELVRAINYKRDYWEFQRS